jgi:hypothetical protein
VNLSFRKVKFSGPHVVSDRYGTADSKYHNDRFLEYLVHRKSNVSTPAGESVTFDSPFQTRSWQVGDIIKAYDKVNRSSEYRCQGSGLRSATGWDCYWRHGSFMLADICRPGSLLEQADRPTLRGVFHHVAL